MESRVSKRYLYTSFGAATVTEARGWTQPRCPSLHPDKQHVVVQIVDYCSAFTKEPSSGLTRTNLEDAVMSGGQGVYSCTLRESDV